MAPPTLAGIAHELSSFLSQYTGWILAACLVIGAVAIHRNEKRLARQERR